MVCGQGGKEQSFLSVLFWDQPSLEARAVAFTRMGKCDIKAIRLLSTARREVVVLQYEGACIWSFDDRVMRLKTRLNVTAPLQDLFVANSDMYVLSQSGKISWMSPVGEIKQGLVFNEGKPFTAFGVSPGEEPLVAAGDETGAIYTIDSQGKIEMCVESPGCGSVVSLDFGGIDYLVVSFENGTVGIAHVVLKQYITFRLSHPGGIISLSPAPPLLQPSNTVTLPINFVSANNTTIITWPTHSAPFHTPIFRMPNLPLESYPVVEGKALDLKEEISCTHFAPNDRDDEYNERLQLLVGMKTGGLQLLELGPKKKSKDKAGYGDSQEVAVVDASPEKGDGDLSMLAEAQQDLKTAEKILDEEKDKEQKAGDSHADAAKEQMKDLDGEISWEAIHARQPPQEMVKIVASDSAGPSVVDIDFSSCGKYVAVTHHCGFVDVLYTKSLNRALTLAEGTGKFVGRAYKTRFVADDPGKDRKLLLSLQPDCASVTLFEMYRMGDADVKAVNMEYKLPSSQLVAHDMAVHPSHLWFAMSVGRHIHVYDILKGTLLASMEPLDQAFPCLNSCKLSFDESGCSLFCTYTTVAHDARRTSSNLLGDGDVVDAPVVVAVIDFKKGKKLFGGSTSASVLSPASLFSDPGVFSVGCWDGSITMRRLPEAFKKRITETLASAFDSYRSTLSERGEIAKWTQADARAAVKRYWQSLSSPVDWSKWGAPLSVAPPVSISYPLPWAMDDDPFLATTQKAFPLEAGNAALPDAVVTARSGALPGAPTMPPCPPIPGLPTYKAPKPQPTRTDFATRFEQELEKTSDPRPEVRVHF